MLMTLKSYFWMLVAKFKSVTKISILSSMYFVIDVAVNLFYSQEQCDHNLRGFDLYYVPFDFHQAIFLCPSIPPPGWKISSWSSPNCTSLVFSDSQKNFRAKFSKLFWELDRNISICFSSGSSKFDEVNAWSKICFLGFHFGIIFF